MFAYCGNNPVCRKDISGTTSVKIFDNEFDPTDDDREFGGGGNGGTNNGPINKVGYGQAPKIASAGTSYTQFSSDGKNTVISKTVYGEYNMPAYRIDYGGHSHGKISGVHIHYFSVYVGPNGVPYLNKGPVVQCDIF